MPAAMTSSPSDPPLGPLVAEGFALLAPDGLARLAGVPLAALDRLRASWDDLPPDRHLRDGGAYRFRRHGSYVQTLASGALDEVPHRAHWQPIEYNALHGGIERWFEPVRPPVSADPAWRSIVTSIGALFAQAAGGTATIERWFVEAHQFRIDTANGIGRPTPEGAHRDGVDYVAVILVNRVRVRGGETRVFEADGPRGIRFTLSEAWTALLLDDARVIHETTPIQPDGARGWRDTLVLTYRRGGFQSPGAA
jgi:hypothetical protein